MSFNKIKAMKNAERYLTQGKTQAAINEYKQVVENDPKDFNSRNMLGDLYTKADEIQAAINCYQEVAEHYNSQGFAKKAIAIYNKIFRLDSNSLEVSIKLAELYQTRGSAAEARKHFQEIAKRYEQKGHKLEALTIWEKIAELAPRDTEIHIKIADAYWHDNRKEDAAKAFVEAGKRFVLANKLESAITSFSRSLEVNPEDFEALRGFVDAQTKLGYPEEGAAALENILDKHQYNKEINYLLMDCYFEMDDIEKAEEIILKLIEREPANYPKLLELVNVYLEKDDLDSAMRMLSMSSEHMLVGGEFEELLDLINEVLARNPEHIEALRLLARYYGWHRDEIELQQTLERLAEAAYIIGSIEDERYALTQYLLLAPHDNDRSKRLQEIKNEYGGDNEVGENLLSSDLQDVPTFESFAALNEEEDSGKENGFASAAAELSDKEAAVELTDQDEIGQLSTENSATLENQQTQIDADINKQANESELEIQVSNLETPIAVEVESVESALSATEERRIDEEIESINFYIEQGYDGLAEKSLTDLEKDFGVRPEFVELREKLSVGTEELTNEGENLLSEQKEESDLIDDKSKEIESETVFEASQETIQDQGVEVQQIESKEEPDAEVESFEEESPTIESEAIVSQVLEDEEIPELPHTDKVSAEINEHLANEFDEDSVEETQEEEEEPAEHPNNVNEKVNSFDDFKESLNLDEVVEFENTDYEEHYQHAVVYQEMGMLEEAIREFQDAVSCVSVDDGTKRYLNCCTLLGHCFMEKAMPKLALKWFEKAVECVDLDEAETLGIYYEIANAHYENDEAEKALEQFEMIYALDVDYRDISERIEKLRGEVLTPA